MAKAEINKKTSELTVVVEAKKETWKKNVASAEKHLIDNLSLKGFRKGKVPKDMALKHIKKEEIYSHAIQNSLEEMGTEANKAIPADATVLAAPGYLVDKVDGTQLVLKFIYPVYPEIKLADYKKLGVKLDVKKVEKATIDEEIKKLTEAQTMLKDKAGAIAKGDVAIFDFEGFVDGKPFDGGKAEKYQLEIGSGQFIPGFEDQMVGLKKGDKKDVKVTFPKEYHSEDLKGKEATFKIVLHEVKSKVKGELTEEVIKGLGIKDVKDLAGLKKYIESVFTEQYRQETRGKFHREAFDKILEGTEFVIPAALISQEMQGLSQQFAQQLQQQNMTIEQYMEMSGLDRVKMDAQFKAQAEARLKDALVFAEIAKIEKIELTDADYEAEYKKLAKVYGQTEEGIKGVITKQQMQVPMTNDKVIDKLVGYNK